MRAAALVFALPLLLALAGHAAADGKAADAESCAANDAKWQKHVAKMKAAELSQDFVRAFKNSFDALVAGDTGSIPEDTIEPLAKEEVPKLVGLRESGMLKEMTAEERSAMLSATVVLKLNGGLGTSMGLDKAKSLLEVKEGITFLDLIAKQVLRLREQFGDVHFMLMNSFSTSADTLRLLGGKYPELLKTGKLEVVQNKAPKVDKKTLQPVEWEVNPRLEWAPPGHGDLYAALSGSGTLQRLVDDGFKYLFVSNSDNLGASLDLELLTYFAQSQKPFVMEVCERTAGDKKGGHLARRKSDSRLLLREVAQCSEEDEKYFKDIERYRFFNTNNLWLRLDKLAEHLKNSGGAMPLPLIVSHKTVDPRDSSSPEVYQLETAMGAAVAQFDGAGAVVVPRSRFSPVKKTHDLMALRSDAYAISENFTVSSARSPPLVIDLDKKNFKIVAQLEAALQGSVPSLVGCSSLKVKGPVIFGDGVTFKGDVSIVNKGKEPKTVLPGVYDGVKLDLTDNVGLGPLLGSAVPTQPVAGGQAPSAVGLVRAESEFRGESFLENYVQAIFNAHSRSKVRGSTLLIASDHHAFGAHALQVVAKLAVGAGVGHVLVSKDMPGSAVLNEILASQQSSVLGALTFSQAEADGHVTAQFLDGKGAPPSEQMLADIAFHAASLNSYRTAAQFPRVDVSKLGVTAIEASDKSRSVYLEVM